MEANDTTIKYTNRRTILKINFFFIGIQIGLNDVILYLCYNKVY